MALGITGFLDGIALYALFPNELLARIEVDGLELDYDLLGDAGAPPLVLEAAIPLSAHRSRH